MPSHFSLEKKSCRNYSRQCSYGYIGVGVGARLGLYRVYGRVIGIFPIFPKLQIPISVQEEEGGGRRGQKYSIFLLVAGGGRAGLLIMMLYE